MSLPSVVKSSPRAALFTPTDVLEATGGHWVQGSHQAALCPAPVHTDTRSLEPGDWFLALAGERWDGHNFLQQAVEAIYESAGKPGGLIIHHESALEALNLPEAMPVVRVSHTTWAYLALGAYHRQRLPQVTVIALTGSNGKTTAKELLLAALSPVCRVQATAKNHNNEIGVAQTLCSLTPETDVLIVEMGMRGLGQIEPLSQAAQPNVAAVLNVGPAHIGLLGSLEAIARAKSEIFTGLSSRPSTFCSKPTAVVWGDDPLLWDSTLQAPTLEVQKALPSSVPYDFIPVFAFQAQAVVTGPDGVEFDRVETDCSTRIQLGLPGFHAIQNALLVLAMGQCLGFSSHQLAPGLASYHPVEGRWHPAFCHHPQTCQPIHLIQDAYNANPASMMAGLETLHQMVSPHDRILLVLGGMKELGEWSEHYHNALGQWLANSPQAAHTHWVLVGEEMEPVQKLIVEKGFQPQLHCVAGPLQPFALQKLVFELQECLATVLPTPGVWWVYVKGSRFYQLDVVAAQLQAALDPV
ncbi:MAG: UDP-N-acetylmuramoyl-tripeptide--D-alanyl-D-alanine ligase [Vampirovibrionales bacterium]